MKLLSRAALAASLGLWLSACATIDDTPPVTDLSTGDVETETRDTVELPDVDEAVKAADDLVDGVDGAAPVDSADPVQSAEMASDSKEMPSPVETLLYGAMTKWELQSFVAQVSEANVSDLFEGEGPLTVFAPNNSAFEYASIGADVDLPDVLKGHVVTGAMDSEALMSMVAENNGPVTLTSLSGAELTVYVMDDKVKVAGPGGTLGTVVQPDMMQSNGVMHQISSVLMP